MQFFKWHWKYFKLEESYNLKNRIWVYFGILGYISSFCGNFIFDNINLSLLYIENMPTNSKFQLPQDAITNNENRAK